MNYNRSNNILNNIQNKLLRLPVLFYNPTPTINHGQETNAFNK